MIQETPVVYRVVKTFQAPQADPLVVSGGERLAFERRETEWPGWIWCVDESGKSGWVPEAWVCPEGETCVMRRDYDGTELSVADGEEFAVTLTESGWAWGTTSDGRKGWVPMAYLEKIEHGGKRQR